MARLRNSHTANALRWGLNFRGQRYAITRRYVFDALSRVTPSVAVDTDGLRLFISTSDREVSRETFARGAYERALFARVLDELKRTDVLAWSLEGRGFLDIGANIGSATCLALRAHGAGCGWAFEPAPQNVTLLKLNLVANALDERVDVFPVALSDHDGTAAFELSDTSYGDHRVRVEDGPSDSRPALLGETERLTVDVQARRLDGLVDDGSLDLASVALAWIDVQGHEGHVLAGASQLLASDVPIVCEYWPYGLRRAGGLERFHSLLARSRSRFINLGTPDGLVLPIDRLRGLADRHESLAATDLLVLP